MGKPSVPPPKHAAPNHLNPNHQFEGSPPTDFSRPSLSCPSEAQRAQPPPGRHCRHCEYPRESLEPKHEAVQPPKASKFPEALGSKAPLCCFFFFFL